MPRRGLTRRCKVRINGLRNDALRLAAWPLLVATAALAAGGCASGPQLPFSMPKFSFFKGKEPDKTGMEKLEQLAAEHRDRPLISPDSPPQTPAWRRFLQQPFQAKPRVAQVPDAVNLKNRPESVNADVFLHAARLHEVQGHLTAAADSYQRALSADPNHEGTLLSFARMHDRNGEFAEATKLYERAVAANPNSAVAFNDYGLCSVRQGQTTRGLQLMSKAIAHYELGNLDEFNRLRERLVDEFADLRPSAIAQLEAVAGNIDAAFFWLDKHLAQPKQIRGVNYHSPFYENLRSDPRWHEYRRQMGLSPEQLARIDFSPVVPY